MYENPSESSQSFEGTSRSSSIESEEMMGRMKEEGSKRYAAAREKLREHWEVAKGDLDNLKQKAVDYSQSAAKATNTFAHDHPWTTAGAAVGVGALIGWLVTRRTTDIRHHHHSHS